MLVHNPKGNYSFVRGISPYSAGAIADRGFEVEHVRFREPVALRAGFQKVEQWLKDSNRPKQALCGMELRSPKPFTFRGFNEFNAGYVDVLKQWAILMDGGLNPVARTNVAPEIDPPAEPSLHGFCYTKPSRTTLRTFVVAGAGELPEGSLDPHDVIRRGETSQDALIEKTRFVMGLMEGRLTGLGVSWNDVNATDIYTIHPICAFLAKEILGRMGKGKAHGVTWHFTRPPIESIEYEMDLRGTATEVVI